MSERAEIIKVMSAPLLAEMKAARSMILASEKNEATTLIQANMTDATTVAYVRDNGMRFINTAIQKTRDGMRELRELIIRTPEEESQCAKEVLADYKNREDFFFDLKTLVEHKLALAEELKCHN